MMGQIEPVSEEAAQGTKGCVRQLETQNFEMRQIHSPGKSNLTAVR